MTKCYMCSNEAVTVDHIPPKCLFPEKKDLPEGMNYRKNLITVPSCEEHNLKRSGDDEYLLFVLASNININLPGLLQLTSKLKRSMIKQPTKKRIYKNLTPVIYNKIITASFDIDYERIERQFDRISRGIYFYHYKEQWTQGIDVNMPFALSIGDDNSINFNHNRLEFLRMVEGFMVGVEKSGNNPEIFYYQLMTEQDQLGFILKMVFYGGIEVVAISNQYQLIKNENI